MPGSSTELSKALSQLLVAFTIEFDNEAEARLEHRTSQRAGDSPARGPWLVSLPMWANFMQFIAADGTPLHQVSALSAITNLPGLQRWGYLNVEPSSTPRSAAMVRPTRAGLAAQDVWRPLAGEIEGRWRQRFGPAAVAELCQALHAVADRIEEALPPYLPVVPYSNGMRADNARNVTLVGHAATDLPSLLSRVLLALTLEFEAASPLSLTICANTLRLLDEDGVKLRDLPRLSGVSKEMISAALGFLKRRGLLLVEPDPATGRGKTVRLTPGGLTGQHGYRAALAAVDQRWSARFGAQHIDRLHRAMAALIQQRDGVQKLGQGLRPHADGWRSRKPFLTQTNALITDPVSALPHHPAILHRGGFPDGS